MTAPPQRLLDFLATFLIGVSVCLMLALRPEIANAADIPDGPGVSDSYALFRLLNNDGREQVQKNADQYIQDRKDEYQKNWEKLIKRTAVLNKERDEFQHYSKFLLRGSEAFVKAGVGGLKDVDGKWSVAGGTIADFTISELYKLGHDKIDRAHAKLGDEIIKEALWSLESRADGYRKADFLALTDQQRFEILNSEIRTLLGEDGWNALDDSQKLDLMRHIRSKQQNLIEQMYSELGNVRKDIADLAQGYSQMGEDIENNKKAIKELKRRSDVAESERKQLRKELNQALSDARARKGSELTEQKKRDIQKKIDDANYRKNVKKYIETTELASNQLKSVASIANDLGIGGDAAEIASHAAKAIQISGVIAAATVNPSMILPALAQSVSFLKGITGGKQANPDPAMQQLAAISKQIKRLHRDMHRRFDEVFRQMAAYHKEIIDDLRNIEGNVEFNQSLLVSEDLAELKSCPELIPEKYLSRTSTGDAGYDLQFAGPPSAYQFAFSSWEGLMENVQKRMSPNFGDCLKNLKAKVKAEVQSSVSSVSPIYYYSGRKNNNDTTKASESTFRQLVDFIMSNRNGEEVRTALTVAQNAPLTVSELDLNIYTINAYRKIVTDSDSINFIKTNILRDRSNSRFNIMDPTITTRIAGFVVGTHYYYDLMVPGKSFYEIFFDRETMVKKRTKVRKDGPQHLKNMKHILDVAVAQQSMMYGAPLIPVIYDDLFGEISEEGKRSSGWLKLDRKVKANAVAALLSQNRLLARNFIVYAVRKQLVASKASFRSYGIALKQTSNKNWMRRILPGTGWNLHTVTARDETLKTSYNMKDRDWYAEVLGVPIKLPSVQSVVNGTFVPTKALAKLVRMREQVALERSGYHLGLREDKHERTVMAKHLQAGYSLFTPHPFDAID